MSHVNERIQLRGAGLAAIVFFLIKMQSIKHSRVHPCTHDMLSSHAGGAAHEHTVKAHFITSLRFIVPALLKGFVKANNNVLSQPGRQTLPGSCPLAPVLVRELSCILTVQAQG